MIQLYKMAYRDLGRNRRRSFLSALALGMGLALLLLMAAVIAGETRDALNSSIKLVSGELQIRANTYNEDKTSLGWSDLIENPDNIAAQVAALPQVKVATPRLLASGIVSVGDQSLGVRIMGVDPASAANAPFRDGLIAGTFITAADQEGILIGKTLAEKIQLAAGDKILLLVNSSSGGVEQQYFTIRGIFSTKTPTFDESTVFLPITSAQAISGAGNHASLIFILLKDRAQTAAVAAGLQNGTFQIKTWDQLNEMLVQTEQLSTAYMGILYLIVLGVTATVIVNTLIMSVFERTREIGILSAIGMKASRIMAMFFAESSLLAVGGIAMGLVLGGLLVAYATYVGFYIGNMAMTGLLLGERIYGYLTLKDTLNLSLLALIVTLLAALYPALVAARMEPVEALHGGK